MNIIPFIDIHTHNLNVQNSALQTSIFNFNPLEQLHPPAQRYFSLSFYPWDTPQISLPDWIARFGHYLQDPLCVALGEIGMDARFGNIELQEKTLKALLSWNQLYNRPVILHAVRSFDKIFHTIKYDHPQFTYIIHDSHLHLAQINSLALHNVYFSFNLKTLHHLEKRKKHLDFFNAVPLDKIFLETDDAKNSNQLLQTYEKICALKNVSMIEMKKSCWLNATSIFGIGQA